MKDAPVVSEMNYIQESTGQNDAIRISAVDSLHASIPPHHQRLRLLGGERKAVCEQDAPGMFSVNPIPSHGHSAYPVLCSWLHVMS